MLDITYHTISFSHSSNFCVDGNEKAKEEIRLAYYFEYLNRRNTCMNHIFERLYFLKTNLIVVPGIKKHIDYDSSVTKNPA